MENLNNKEKQDGRKKGAQKRAREKYEKTHRINKNNEIEKFCPICKEWKLCNEEYFYKNKSNKTDGLCPNCKECDIEKSKQRIKDIGKEAFIAGVRASQIRHEDTFKKYQHDYDIKNREQRRNKLARWQKSLKGKERTKKYSEKRYHKNHKVNKKEWISCKEYFSNKEGEYCCAYCGLPISQHFKLYRGEITNIDLHKEHVIHNGENDLSNCIPSCQSCNSSKSKNEMEIWFREKEFFTEERLQKIYKWLDEDYKLYIAEHKPKRKYIKKAINT